MTEERLEGHFVREFTVGNTRIRIADDYCRNQTQEEVDRILCEIARTAQAHITAAYNRSTYEQD